AECDAERGRTILPGLPGWPEGCVAVRHCVAFIRRESRPASGSATAFARSLPGSSLDIRRCEARCFLAALLCVCLCPYHAGDGGVRIPWLLRTEVPLPAVGPVCTEKYPMASAQRGTAHPFADASRSVQEHCRLGETAEPCVRNRKSCSA